MNIRATPDAGEKLDLLADASRFEPAGDGPESAANSGRAGARLMPCISHVSTPKGKKAVLKAMLTTACEKNCYYCPFRAGRSRTRRITFQPEELAHTFDQMQRAKLVDGLFLSSGIIKGGITTQDRLLDTIEIVRRRYHYAGYVHLKIMPGADYEQVRRAMQLADRVSINLEGPTAARLTALAPKKDFTNDLLQHLTWTQEIRQQFLAETGRRIRASTSTQFVVGAVGDTDLELLALTERLYQHTGIQRAYYSAFEPVRDTPFENLTAVSPIRERRLYQSSFLLRDYAWDVEDLPFQPDGNLLLDADPKKAWADAHLRHTPVELMQASPHELLRIPGIGPRGAEAILKARGQGRLNDLSYLRALGIRAPEQAAPYILLDGQRPAQQLALFDTE